MLGKRPSKTVVNIANELVQAIAQNNVFTKFEEN